MVERFMSEHHLTRYGNGGEIRPFSSKIICGECGCLYDRKAHAGREKKTYWQCNTRCYHGPKGCRGENIREDVIHRVFIEAWNTLVRQKDRLKEKWDQQEKEETELQKFRARQMNALVMKGPVTFLIPELVQAVLESITIEKNRDFEVGFLDGSRIMVSF